MILTYVIIAVLLFAAELLYFCVADHFNIIDKPNERSSHSKVVLRGGGIIFTISMIVWAVVMAVQGRDILAYLPFLGGLLLIAGVSFVDDVHSLPDSVRLVAQCASMALMAWSLGVLQPRGAGAAGAAERAAEPGRGGRARGRIYRAVVPDGGGAGRAGVRLVQLPAAREGEVLRGRRRGGGHRLHHAVRPGAADDEDGRRDLAGVPGRVWRGRVLHDRAPDYAA